MCCMIDVENQRVAVNNTFVLYQGQREQMSSRLDSKESRKSWENTFNQVYIQPVLEVTILLQFSLDFIHQLSSFFRTKTIG